jgi:hypothetical protein
MFFRLRRTNIFKKLLKKQLLTVVEQSDKSPIFRNKNS